jgi:hypothetical protein
MSPLNNDPYSGFIDIIWHIKHEFGLTPGASHFIIPEGVNYVKKP